MWTMGIYVSTCYVQSFNFKFVIPSPTPANTSNIGKAKRNIKLRRKDTNTSIHC